MASLYWTFAETTAFRHAGKQNRVSRSAVLSSAGQSPGHMVAAAEGRIDGRSTAHFKGQYQQDSQDLATRAFFSFLG